MCDAILTVCKAFRTWMNLKHYHVQFLNNVNLRVRKYTYKTEQNKWTKKTEGMHLPSVLHWAKPSVAELCPQREPKHE